MNIDVLKMLGKKVPLGTGEIRDAVHIAVITVGVIERVYPGQHVGLTGGLADPKQTKRIGIIDPYLEESAFPGDAVFLYLYPGTITSLFHHWSHPLVPDNKPKEGTDSVLKAALELVKKERDEWEEKWMKAEEKRRLLQGQASMNKAEAEKFLRELATEHCVDYDRMVDDIAMHGTFTQQGSTSLENEWNKEGKAEKVYLAIEAVTGKPVDRSTWSGPFSCSC